MAFRFETLLKLRKNVEDLVQKDFAGANSHLLNQQKRLGFMYEVEDDSKKELGPRTRENVDIDTMYLYNHFFEGIHIQKNLQQKIISEISPKVEEKRKALAEAMRKRKTLEILKEREQRARRRERLKQETALLDEAAATQWRRRL
ncbi:MAG: flagellar export protein FliJ [Nitrospinales bacterium]